MNPGRIRTIHAADNPFLATIVRDTLTEFGANKPDTVFYDPTTDHLFELFQIPGAIYYVLEVDGQIVGGAGIYPSPGLPGKTCELVKMYLRPHIRGQGYGKILIEKCFSFARTHDYTQIYIETMPELKRALKMYEKMGFEYLRAPLGNTGHSGCDLWMLKKIN